MSLVQRSYAGKTFRPKPLLHELDGPSVLVVSSWGARDEAERVAQIFQDQLGIADAEDFTSPFGHLENMSPKANRLRTACLLANDLLYRDINQSEYLAAVEILALVIEDRVMSWVQVGSPHLLLHSKGTCQPLAYNLDWSWQYSQASPLPCLALGIESAININYGSIILPKDAEILLLSRGAVPSPIFQSESVELDLISRILINDNPDTPFWLGQLTVTG